MVSHGKYLVNVQPGMSWKGDIRAPEPSAPEKVVAGIIRVTAYICDHLDVGIQIPFIRYYRKEMTSSRNHMVFQQREKA